jgi:hypothetical protein
MAKSNPGTKADAIREILKADPHTPTRTVVAQLAGKGIKVSDNHVYLIKSKMKHRKQRQKRAKWAAVTQLNGTPNPVQAVTKVKILARELGGLKNLKQLVDVLSE